MVRVATAGRRDGGRVVSGPLGCAEPVRREPAERVTLAEELGPRQQRDQRLGEQEDHDDVDQGGQAEGEGEAADAADGEQVEHRRGEERHEVGGQDGPPGPRPAGLDGDPQGAPVADLVADPFEVDDERVRGDADGDDQAGDAGEAEPEAQLPAEQRHHAVGDDPRDEQRRRGDEAEAAVVQQRVEDDQRQADRAGDQAGSELLAAEGRGHLLHLAGVERQRQGAELEDVGQVARLVLAEVAADLRLAVGDDGVGRRAPRRRARRGRWRTG